MGMLQRLRDAHPGVTITAYDGHYCKIGDDQSDIIDHIKIEDEKRTAYADSVENGRRTKPTPKAIEARLNHLISIFKGG